ncbi:acetyl-CoA carboxylase, biotin carboxyl carrier protein [Flavobacteria bacterium MS024-3C]|jgi:acetyl-CoA carboxylase biotin carboxyl carrier protein|nr:acetyl-CoA carboxylase, biotin carboxyl carrier protein [Flavobacteria bacterium MS024-3C]MDA9252764.1 acetyl-CoA carboxylase biotin carboxyl carrier protein [Flavobacteriaceae bacterium]NQV63251.1 acetyl-CoA carboxylase biotin carboxyl carrier protein [Cryomorphaceae bacterium]MDA9273068.1 acetyl-CoA carboxylase biotin carboxyl carrier protein [Flavobacteriaceae bacterium]MDB4004801.1 acetyl-CoA carboxylase biotin carboxyl carrier protein [Flavobacteriaceae bacterium]|tara:strand:- start:1103 stop:1573 length:471 start_codon:yes stop_codon:yes gene_type:complete
MDIKEIQNLIKFVAKSGASEVKLETEDLKITIRTGPLGAAVSEPVYMQQMPMAASPVAPSTDASAPAVQTAPASEDHLITIKSPIIGTFYRRPSPDKANFVEVGSEIGKGDVLCVIEAMKLFNDIESEVSGKIVKVLVDDSSPVEFDQPLFVVDPS